MEWNAKWDWENLVMFNSKSIKSSKKLQPKDWGIEEEGDIDAMSFNTSTSSGGGGGGGGGGGDSGSDLGLGSFAKSSITASTDSSSKEGIKTSNFTFEAFECFAEDFNKKREFTTRADQTENSPPPEASVGSGEPLIGLKLGKRTYFKNNFTGSNIKNSSFSVIPEPVSSVTAVKRFRPSGQTMPPPRCQVAGCNLDLSSAKGYHKKHKVCESHSKCPKVIVDDLERRFCQQCSRFHTLSEFDEKKRSCRRRLSDHNARRRKPHQEEIQFKSTGLSLPSYSIDGRQQLSFELQNYPFVHTELASPTCTRTHAINIFGHDSSRLLPCKGSRGTRAEVFNQDLKDSKFSCNFDVAQDHRRALSLLSTNAYGSQPEPVIYNNHMHANHYSMHQPTTMHALPQGLPCASSAYSLTEPRSTDSHAFTANIEGTDHFQETQMIKMEYLSSSYNVNPSN